MKHYLLLSILLCLGFNAFSQSASIRETTMTFRTYGYSDPDPIAKPGKIYPYFRFDGYTNTPEDKEWKIIVMENDWIKVLIAPEIGGKVLGAIEKSTGNEFIYFNKVVKFRDVAMRGPWTSGGIEYNFGSIGHAPTTSSPVDYLTMENPDGSVSCFIGDIDLSSRTEWRVEVRLPADKAWFETHANWYNPTDFSTSKYHWMNAAADAPDDLKFYWPGGNYIGHGGDVHDWPLMSDGRDISQYAQNNYGNYHSYHVLGEVTDYYGGYYKTKDFGFGHLTDYAIKPGKKIWIWGLARQGEIWVDLLTDPDLGNGQYTEIQTGLLFNQAGANSTKTPFKHREFKSKESERFTEYWFPVKNTGGITDINEYGILNIQGAGLKAQGSRLKAQAFVIRFCALQEVHDSLYITLNDSLSYSFRLDLQPMEVFKSSVNSHQSSGISQVAAPLAGHLISFDLRKSKTELQKSDRPLQSPAFDWTTLQGKYITALEDSRQRNYNKALKGYYSCLEEDQNYMPALVGAAQELMRISKYNNAENLLKRTLSIDTYQPRANYLLGIINKKNGEYYRAIEAFGLSTRSMEYRSAAFVQLSEVSILMKNYPKALQYAEASLDYNRFNISAYKLSILANRLLGNTTEAQHTLDVLLEMDPLNHMARFENYLLLPDKTNLEVFQSNIKTEMPAQVYLELALFYHNLKLDKDALTLLDQAPDNVLIDYLKAYLTKSNIKNITPMKSGTIELVFPYRQEMNAVFEWAENIAPSWINRYYMGLINWNNHQLDKAHKLFRSCGDEPESPAFYLSRTRLFEGVDTELVVHDLERALKLDPHNWRSYKYLVDFYMKHGAYPIALEFAKKGARQAPDNFILQVDLAKAELYNKNYGKCLKILDEVTILPAEGAQAGHELYRQAHLLQAVEEYKNGKSKQALQHISKAREWPENLGVGKAYVTDERIENYLEGLILMAEKHDDKASEAFAKVIDYTEENKPSWDSPYLLLAYSMQILGHEEQAIKILSEWMKVRSKDPIAHWAIAMYSNMPDRAEQALNRYKDSSGGTPWNPGGGDPQFRLVYEIVNQIQLK
ncbi:MAG: DUF5107 domain-containing protein [Bacteroidales bacterium]|nr:DUF5107 domain-containing protein [Bacteroidales bacterium]